MVREIDSSEHIDSIKAKSVELRTGPAFDTEEDYFYLEVGYPINNLQRKSRYRVSRKILVEFAQDVLKYIQPTPEDRILDVLERIEEKLSEEK